VNGTLRQLARPAAMQYTTYWGHSRMGIFHRRVRDPDRLPRPPDGQGVGDLMCRVRRCMYRDIAVVDTNPHPGGRALIAGPRPPNELWREKTITVRLVREYADPVDPDAIAVLAASGEHLGQVCAVGARRMAPAIDGALGAIAARREFWGCAVDIDCTALVIAEWETPGDAVADPDEDLPAVVEVTLLADDAELGIAVTAPEIPVCV
jgi:hypothetical protein